MAGKVRLVEADRLVADSALERNNLRQTFDKKKRSSMWKKLLELLHVENCLGMSTFTHFRSVSASSPDWSMHEFRESIRVPAWQADRHSPSHQRNRCRARSRLWRRYVLRFRYAYGRRCQPVRLERQNLLGRNFRKFQPDPR